MKKRVFNLIGLLATTFVFGQTVPNGGFENWGSYSYEEPTNYQTSNSQNSSGTNPGNAIKSTDAFHGLYAIKLTTVTNGTDTTFAYFANGDPGQSPPKGGMPYNQKPTGFRCHYKSNIVGTDSAIILIIFKKAGANIGTYLYKIGTTQNSYTLFNPTFNPALSIIPDTVVFASASSNPFVSNGIPGNMLQLDSISFSGVTSQPAGLNGDLELWQSRTVNSLINWTNSNSNGGTMRTAGYTGTYALELQTIGPSFGGNNQVQQGSVLTGINQHYGPPTGGHPYSTQIDTLVFYYEYIPADPNDSANVSISFSAGGVNIGGYRELLGTQAGSYAKVMIPYNLTQIPDTALISISSSSYTTFPCPNSFVGSDLKIDNMYLVSQKLPVTNFTLPLTGCVGVPIQLKDSTLNMVTGWTWVTGGGTQTGSDPENPIVTYNTQGVKTVSMLASNSFGNGAHIFKTITIYANPTLSITSATVCQGNQANLMVSGANTYMWSTSATTASISVSPTITATYSVVGIDGNGCRDSIATWVTVLSAPVPSICMVTVDDSSIYNIIYWDKTAYNNVDSFIAYRETSSNNYKRIGAQSYAALSQFIDTARSVGGPNGGNPNTGTYRYKLQTVDTCGNYSSLSLYHNTVFITTNGTGQFSWATPYQIEGQPSPDTNYVLACDTANTNVWTAVASVSGSQQTLADPGFTHHATIANWRVDALGFNCNPTMFLANGGNNSPLAAKIKSHSNQANNRSSGIKQLADVNQVNVYPNPSQGAIAVLTAQKMYGLKVTDVLGNTIFDFKPDNQKMTLQFENSGIYFIIITFDNQSITKKVIIDK